MVKALSEEALQKLLYRRATMGLVPRVVGQGNIGKPKRDRKAAKAKKKGKK